MSKELLGVSVGGTDDVKRDAIGEGKVLGVIGNGTNDDVELDSKLEVGKERRESERGALWRFGGEMGCGEGTCAGCTSSVFLRASHAGRKEKLTGINEEWLELLREHKGGL